MKYLQIIINVFCSLIMAIACLATYHQVSHSLLEHRMKQTMDAVNHAPTPLPFWYSMLDYGLAPALLLALVAVLCVIWSPFPEKNP